MSWEFVRLSEICRNDAPITYGILQPGPEVEDGVPYVRPSEIKAGQIDTSSIRRTSAEIAARYKKSVIREGDILITIVGTIGHIATVPSNLDGGNITQSSARIRVCSSRADRSYIKNYLRSPLAKRQYDRHRLGAAVARLNLHHVRDLQIPLPPLPEQRRIAAILDKADAACRKRQQTLDLADQFLRSAFLDLFGDPVTNPKGWPVKKLGEISLIRRGGSPRPISEYLGGSVPWIKIGDATGSDDIYIDSTAEFIKLEGVKKSLFLEPGSLVLANSGVSLGFARILRIAGCVHDGWLALSEFEASLNTIFLLKMLNSITDYFRITAPSGTQPNLNIGILRDLPVPVPPKGLQESFAQLSEHHDTFTKQMVRSSQVQNGLSNSLTQRAFRGEL